MLSGDQLLLPALRVRATRCSTHYERHPDVRRAGRAPATRWCRSSAGACRTCRSRRSTFDWGIPVPWDDDAGRLRLVRRAAQLRHRRRARRRAAACRGGEVRRDLAGRRPPGRQGHPALPRGDLAGDADGRRAAAARAGLRPRLAAGRRREDEQVQADRHRRRRRSSTTSASDAFRYYFLRAIQFGQDGSFSWEDMTRALHLRARQRAGQPRLAGDRDGRPVLRRRAARARAVRQRGPGARRRPARGRRRTPTPATRQLRLHRRASARSRRSSTRSTSTSPSRSRGRWPSGPTTRPHASGWPPSSTRPARRCAAIAVLHNAVMPRAMARLWEALGAAEGLGPIAEQRIEQVAGWGQLPAGVRGHQGRRAVPAAGRGGRRRCLRPAAWPRARRAPEPLPRPVVDSHCHLDMRGGDERRADRRASRCAAAAAVNVTGIVQVGCSIRDAGAPRCAMAQAHPQIVAAIGIHPNEAPRLAAPGELDAALDEVERAGAPRIRGSGASARPAWTTSAPASRRAGRSRRSRSGAHIDMARRLGRALVIHDRDAHDDVIRVLLDEAAGAGLPEVVVFHCFSGDAAMARLAADHGWYLSFAGTVTFSNARDLHARCAGRARATGSWSRPTRRSSRRPRTAGRSTPATSCR